MANPTTSPFNITPPAPPTAPDLNQYISIAEKQLSPGFSDVVDAATKAGQTQQQGFQKLADDTLASTSIVQKTYADLAAEFKVQQKQETDTATTIGSDRIGGAKVALANAGVTDAQGAFRAPVTQAENDLQSTIGQIATKYGAKEQEIADTLTANVQQIQQKADEYLSQGNNALADTLTKVAELKYNQQQQVITLSQQMAAAETTYEQNSWKDYMDIVNAQHQQATLDLMSERLANTEAVDQQRLGIEQQNANTSAARLSLASDTKVKSEIKSNLDSDVAAGIQSLATQIGSGKTAPFATEQLAKQMADAYQKAYEGNAPSEDEILNKLYAERDKPQYKNAKITF